jgi:cytoskeletal protein RodZ
MGKNTGKRTLVTTLSVLAVLLLVIGAIALFRLNAKPDPYVAQDEKTSDDTSQTTQTPDDSSSSDTATTPQPETSQTIDPATTSTIDIVPMAITVSYTKGVGPFEYAVLRAQNGTRYVEFRSTNLVGSKCTNDEGTFASIIADPTEAESTALSKTTTVDGVKYGLSLADATCTSDSAALQKYQQSFSDAFTLLKKLG